MVGPLFSSSSSSPHCAQKISFPAAFGQSRDSTQSVEIQFKDCCCCFLWYSGQEKTTKYLSVWLDFIHNLHHIAIGQSSSSPLQSLYTRVEYKLTPSNSSTIIPSSTNDADDVGERFHKLKIKSLPPRVSGITWSEASLLVVEWSGKAKTTTTTTKKLKERERRGSAGWRMTVLWVELGFVIFSQSSPPPLLLLLCLLLFVFLHAVRLLYSTHKRVETCIHFETHSMFLSSALCLQQFAGCLHWSWVEE